MESLLFHCYRGFYSSGHALTCIARARGNGADRVVSDAAVIATSLFHHYSVAKRGLPMSGGLKRVRADSADLRRRAHGFDHAPLPGNLPLPLANHPARERALAM